MSWYDGQVSGPSNGDVVADTGAQAAGNVTFAAAVHSTLPCTFEVQHVASDNTTVVHKQKLSVLSGNGTLNIAPIYATLGTNERLRVIAAQALPLGSVDASIFVY
jgi:hypothetical protein